jgi:hypothetical protein
MRPLIIIDADMSALKKEFKKNNSEEVIQKMMDDLPKNYKIAQDTQDIPSESIPTNKTIDLVFLDRAGSKVYSNLQLDQNSNKYLG